jgi:putative acetyltransferase
MEIREDDLTGPAIVGLLESHLENMKEITPPESVHALGVDRLRSPGITVWSAWEGDVLLGCGALKILGPTSGEIKAMRTADAHRGKGVGSRVLEHIIAEGQRRGYSRLYLETAASADFSAAQRLYEKYGFEYRGPFAAYVEDPNSVFMSKSI